MNKQFTMWISDVRGDITADKIGNIISSFHHLAAAVEGVDFTPIEGTDRSKVYVHFKTYEDAKTSVTVRHMLNRDDVKHEVVYDAVAVDGTALPKYQPLQQHVATLALPLSPPPTVDGMVDICGSLFPSPP